jgi:hypothetical protein
MRRVAVWQLRRSRSVRSRSAAVARPAAPEPARRVLALYELESAGLFCGSLAGPSRLRQKVATLPMSSVVNRTPENMHRARWLGCVPDSAANVEGICIVPPGLGSTSTALTQDLRPRLSYAAPPGLEFAALRTGYLVHPFYGRWASLRSLDSRGGCLDMGLWRCMRTAGASHAFGALRNDKL